MSETIERNVFVVSGGNKYRIRVLAKPTDGDPIVTVSCKLHELVDEREVVAPVKQKIGRARVLDFYRLSRLGLRRAYYAFLREANMQPSTTEGIEAKVAELLAQPRFAGDARTKKIRTEFERVRELASQLREAKWRE